MNYEAWKFWIDLLQLLLVGGVYVFVGFLNHSKATNARISDVEQDTDQRLDAHESRLSNLEGQLKQLPTHKDMDEIKRALAGLARETSEQTGTMKAMGAQLGRINDWLFEKAK